VSFESINIADGGAGALQWRQAGKPLVPTLMIDGRAIAIQSVAQIAAALGLTDVDRLGSAVLAKDATSLLEDWARAIRDLDWDLLLEPTPSRGRSLRNLTVNVFHPFELLPSAWASGEFAWDPDRDGDRESRLPDSASVSAYVGRTLSEWHEFLRDVSEELQVHDPTIASPRGEVLYSQLLDAQRWHVAFHSRQLDAFLLDKSEAHEPIYRRERLASLTLPAEVF